MTVNLPISLLESVMQGTEKGLTETLVDLLKKEKHRRAYQALEALKGNIEFSMTYEELKELRD